MVNKYKKGSRSYTMSRIKGKDTKPEWIVRRYLFARGYRYRKNVKGLPGTPDIVLKKYGVAIFIHGCFWHGHSIDGHIPHTNSDYWQKKIQRNQERDMRDKEALKQLGWKGMTIWECQLKKEVRENTLKEMEYWINKSFLDKYRSKTYHIEESQPSNSKVAEELVEYQSTKHSK